MSDLKKKLLLNSPYLIFVYLFDKLSQAFRVLGGDMSYKILHIGDGLNYSFSHPMISFNLIDIAIGIAGAVVIRLLVYAKGKNAKNTLEKDLMPKRMILFVGFLMSWIQSTTSKFIGSEIWRIE